MPNRFADIGSPVQLNRKPVVGNSIGERTDFADALASDVSERALGFGEGDFLGADCGYA